MRFGELFGGGGGTGTGLTLAGHSVAWSIEIDQAKASVYQTNHPQTQVMCADVRDVAPTELAPVDGLWLSPVCKQDSLARGKQLPTREDASIGVAAIPYIETLKPALVIIENVSAYQRNPSFSRIVQTLTRMHYTLSLKVLDCADYGIPQHRERLILQARKGPIAWPEKQMRVGWYAAMQDLLDTFQEIQLANWQRQLWKPVYDEMLPAMVHGHYAHKGSSDAILRELDVLPSSLPARTLTASHNVAQRYIVLSDGRVLKPTVQALARLQTFPDWYQWPEKSNLAIDIIGNAVPCRMVEQLTRAYSSKRIAA